MAKTGLLALVVVFALISGVAIAVAGGLSYQKYKHKMSPLHFSPVQHTRSLHAHPDVELADATPDDRRFAAAAEVHAVRPAAPVQCAEAVPFAGDDKFSDAAHKV